MTFIEAVKFALRIVQLDDKAMEEVSQNLDALKWSFIFIAIGGFFAGIGYKGHSFLKAIILTPISFIILALIGITILYFSLNYLFKISFDPVMLFKPIAFASIVNWLSLLGFIPFIGKIIIALAFLWNIIVTIFIIEKITKVSRKEAIINIVIVLVVFLLIDLIFGSQFNLFI